MVMYLGKYVLGYGANDQTSAQAQQPALPELSETAKAHLAELAQAVCDAAGSTPPRETS